MFGCALKGAAQKERRESEERVGTRALDLRGCWVIGWVGEPAVEEEEDDSVDDVFWTSRSSLKSLREELWVCTLVGW